MNTKRYIDDDVRSVIGDSNIPWDDLSGRRVLVTGATGLIGSLLVRSLLSHRLLRKNPVTLLLPVRHVPHAEQIFSDVIDDRVHIFSGRGNEPPESPDYIIHAAAPTASAAFVRQPVEVISCIVSWTRSMLELAKRAHARMVLLSSMEVYGIVGKPEVCENDFGALDPCVPRSSYPEAKRLAECLCAAYAHEYDVAVTITRLAQCFGPGVNLKADERVFAQFTRSALRGEDIVLHTQGATERCYVYTADAVRAVLYALLKGAPGLALNVANPDSYCSVRRLADMFALAGGVGVRVEASADRGAYLPPHKILLHVGRLRSLGWAPQFSLADCVSRLLQWAKAEKQA